MTIMPYLCTRTNPATIIDGCCFMSKKITRAAESLDNAEKLAYSVLSLPVHTELTTEQQDLVIDSIKDFFK